MRQCIPYPAFCILLFLIGCASSAPMSETLTFYNDKLTETTKIHGPRISMASPYFYMFAHYGAFSNLNKPVFFITLSTSLKY